MELFRCSNCHCLISYEDLLCPYCGNKVTDENKIIKEQKNPSQKTNLIIGIITLLIAICGATFAYFSATARNYATVRNAGSGTLKLAYVISYYDGGTEIKATNLIPTTKEVALNNYKKTDRKCIDDKGQVVCYIYEFSNTSNGPTGEFTDILAYITVTKNDFKSLSYVLHEVTLKEEEDNIIVTDNSGFGIVEKYQEISSFENITNNPIVCLFGEKESQEESYAVDAPKKCKTYPIDNNVEHTYHLVMWSEKTSDNYQKQDLTFEGNVTIKIN